MSLYFKIFRLITNNIFKEQDFIYNGNIIYIPNNFKLYMEIPNSQNNYLKQFRILNIPYSNEIVGRNYEQKYLEFS